MTKTAFLLILSFCISISLFAGDTTATRKYTVDSMLYKRINAIDSQLKFLDNERISENKSVEKAVEDAKTQVAIVAAIVTIIFGVFTVSQKRHDRLITVRNKLTDILEKLSNLNMDDAKYRMSQADEKNKLPENYRGLLSDSRRFFVTHAATYVSKLPLRMISSHELNLIAQAFDSIDDYQNAKIFFNKAIERAEHAVDQILSKRNYAKFISLREDRVQGDGIFDNLSEMFKDKPVHDSIRYYLGETYKRWALLHNFANEYEAYKEKLHLAKGEFEKISNTQDRERFVTQIDKMLSQISK